METEELGVLTLPDLQQRVLNLLMRRPPSTAEQIAEQLAVDVMQVEDALNSLLEQGLVSERIISGAICYLVRGTENLGWEFGTEEASRQALTPGKALSVIINPSAEITAVPGSTVEICVTVSNQGDRSAVIDIYMDEVSGAVYQWCEAAQERLALSCGQSSEVVFRVAVPADARPDTYRFMLVVDAPQHYPEDTPIQHQSNLTVSVPIQEVVKVNDPTFRILPRTSPETPQALQPGEGFQLILTVYNQSDRVDRFHVTLPDLEQKWFNIYYPEGIATVGIINASDGLQLNPGDSGKITLVIKPPADTWAGVYTPTVKVHSANNPDLVLLDVVYIAVQPIYQFSFELVTIANRVRKEPALFDLQLDNQSNVVREFSFAGICTDEPDLCTFSFAPQELKMLPKARARVSLEVTPTRKCSPRFFADRYVSFSVAIADKQDLPLFVNRHPGNFMVKSRPWWQFFLVVLAFLGLFGLIIFIFWWFFFRPPVEPEVLEFASEANSYAEVEGEAIKLRWRIANYHTVQTITIVGRSPDNKVISRSVTYDFSRGIPLELREFCAIERVLICQNVPTDARKAGSYIFEMSILPKVRTSTPLFSAKTSSILIAPIPTPQVLQLNSAQPTYVEVKEVKTEASPNDQPPQGIQLNWTISHYRQLKQVIIVGRSPAGEAVIAPIGYDFSLGMPESLQALCQVEGDRLICKNVPTGVQSTGEYVFEVSAIAKQEPSDPSAVPSSRKTDVIKVTPLPIQLIDFKVNGQAVLPRYTFNVSADSPTVLTIAWKLEGSTKMQVELLPAPGTVPPAGQTAIPLPPEASEATYTLQATNPDGSKLTRSFVVQTIPIPPPKEEDKPPAMPPIPEIDSPLIPDPSSGRILAPSEVPPRLN